MEFSYDRTGFPLIPLIRKGLEVHLLPVTKMQFEAFLAESQEFGDTCYEEMLALNPRVPYQTFTSETREQLFLTGILPDEAVAFARWMGEGFTLPTVEEWRAIYEELALGLDPKYDAFDLAAHCPEGACGVILQRLAALCDLDSLFELSLMQGGIVEWVKQKRTYAGLGSPRPEFHPNLWDSRRDIVKPVDTNVRIRYFGFRLIRRIV